MLWTVPGLKPGQDIVLCSQARHLTLAVPLSTQIGGGINTPDHLMSQY